MRVDVYNLSVVFFLQMIYYLEKRGYFVEGNGMYLVNVFFFYFYDICVCLLIFKFNCNLKI